MRLPIVKCFWDGCPERGTTPKNNRAWCIAKIQANRERDAETDALLRARGWPVIRVWEHSDPDRAAKTTARAVSRRSQ